MVEGFRVSGCSVGLRVQSFGVALKGALERSPLKEPKETLNPRQPQKEPLKEPLEGSLEPLPKP